MVQRRELLRWFATGAVAAVGSPALVSFAPGPARAADRPAELEAALSSSPFVYISPLRSDGSESACHAEVWFAYLDGAVVVSVAHDRWKARAVARGLDRARIWVGDYGRWKRLGIASDAYRQGPHFDARAERIRDVAVLDRLLETYDRKYPDEIARWRTPMREGFHDGSRILLAYR